MRYSLHLKTDVLGIPKETTQIHISRPIKLDKLATLKKKAKNLSTVFMSNSCFNRLSSKVKRYLKENKIDTIIEKNKGRPISIELDKLLEIIGMRQHYRSYSEIEKITGIPKSTAHYLIKYADRSKIKKGKMIIHLQ